jgi:hypothetical protein
MSKREKIIMSLFLIATGLCISGCTRNDSPAGTTLSLAGSRQGQAVGFVDVDGDGIEDKLVGAPSAETSQYIGAVLVYKGNAEGFDTAPSQVLEGDDNFGHSFVNTGDIDGDGKDDFAVGAIHGDGAETSLCGSVTLFKGGSNGQIIAKLSGEGPMDKFGTSLAAGDLNADGRPDLVVGAQFNTHDPDLYQSGAVYVFIGPDFTQKITLYASSSRKSLGSAVAAGDVNGDGAADLLMSANGKVLVYYGGASFAPAVDLPDVELKSSASGFGKAVAVIGDLDADGRAELAVGAPNAKLGDYRDTGSVYLVSGSATGTVDLDADTPPAALLARIDGEGLFSRFGAAIQAMGDFDADGKPDFAVGAPMTDVTTTSAQNILSGKVYLFKGKDVAAGTTIANAEVFSGSVKNQAYGTALAKNESNKLLIGAPRASSDTGGVSLVDPVTGGAIAGGSSGGATGGSGDCH